MAPLKHLLIASVAIRQVLSLPTNAPAEDWIGGGQTDYSWNGVKYLFSFGDSYTTTSFDVSGAQPNVGNPLGNPAYPGGTQVGSANYVDYLTLKYNESFIESFNFGFGGATIDYLIDPSPLGDLVQSLRQQVEDEFLPHYGDRQSPAWTSADTLFTVFFGINDVILVNSKSNASDYTTALMKSYADLTQELYHVGARNFVFLNVPAINRTPGSDPSNAKVQQEASYIRSFNRAVQTFAFIFLGTHPDTKVSYFDTDALFNNVLNNPKNYAITSGIKNTTAFCVPYEHSTDPDLFDASCGIPRNEYFWANSLHPTSTVHDLIAEQLVEQAFHAY